MMRKVKFLPPLKIKTKDRLLLVVFLLFVLLTWIIIVPALGIRWVLQRLLKKHRYFELLLIQGMIYERQE